MEYSGGRPKVASICIVGSMNMWVVTCQLQANPLETTLFSILHGMVMLSNLEDT